jgi:hypothetical protein
MRIIKNTIPTSFTIDLTTIDLKVDKLVRFLQNSSIDLKNAGKDFKYADPTYESVIKTFQNRKYKEKLSEFISNIYVKRFAKTKEKLITQGVATETDFLIPRAMDDFGSNFDAFAATNTDPNNTVLQALNVKPYRFLQVDIFDQEEIETYLSNVSTARYDTNKLTYSISLLDSITTSYVDSPNFNFSLINYSKELEEKVFFIKTKGKVSQEQTDTQQPVGDRPTVSFEGQELQEQEYLFQLSNTVPRANNASELIRTYNESSFQERNKLLPAGASNVISQYAASDIAYVIGQELYDTEILGNESGKQYDSKTIEVAKIKIIHYILKNEIQKVLEEKISAISFLNDFRSKYTNYNFLDNRLFSANGVFSKTLAKEQLFFRLTYLRETELFLVNQTRDLFSNLNVEFINSQFITLQSPFGSFQKNDKFVAIVGGSDIDAANNYVDFFQPTILSIISDIDYISSNILEINPFYCPVPQSLQPGFINQVPLRSNQYDINNIENNRNYVEANTIAFDYITFPDKYFIPNFLSGAEDFYESEKEKLTKTKVEENILRFSKYYYSSDAETPAANIIREENINKLFEESLMYNGFGPYEVKKSSFADPLSVIPIISELNNLGDNAAVQLQNIIFARTNIGCLLREFQTCFMPQVGNCRDVLRGFRFTELQQVIERAFPRSIYATLYVSIEEYLIDNARDAREKALLREIKDLEKQLKNNDRKSVAFAEMDKRKEPAEALNVADQSFSNNGRNVSLEELYQQKLQEYKNLKLNQEPQELTEQDKISARRRMQPEELVEIDRFLDFLEQRGINTDILCSLVDLFRISPTFGTITLPELPQFDIYSEIKLSVNLAVARLILDSIVAFIVKILEELLTCGGIKNLLSAAITGEANDSITGAAAAALNQMSRGTFDLDEFVQKNPQVDPDRYAKGMANIANLLPESVTVQENTAIFVTSDVSFGDDIKIDAKTRAQTVLFSPKASATTDTEIKVSLVGLIGSLVRVLTAQRFIEVVSGNGTKEDFVKISVYIQENQPELIYLSYPQTLRNMFSYIGRISGLLPVRNELIAVSSFYSTSNPRQQDIQCLDPSVPDVVPQQRDQLPVNTIDATPTADDKYRELLQDLLSGNPETLKNKIDEEIFKPLLMGMLPDGKKLSSVDAAKKGIIKAAFDTTAGNFKEKTNDLYSKLVYKKQITRTITKIKEIKNEEGDSSEIENSEYKDLVNKGGYPTDYSEPIKVTEKKYVYGGLFTENFTKSSKNLNISSTQQQLKVSLNGNVGYKDDQEEQLNASVGKTWKFENTTNSTNNIYKIFENDKEKFSYQVSASNNENIKQVFDVRQEFNQKLKQTIDTATSTTIDNNIFSQYTNKAYSDFISLIYEKITKQISSDGLLKAINPASMNTESFITGINSNLSSIFPGFQNIGQHISQLPPMVSPFIDTPMKYINFCPKPTKEQKNINVDPGLYGKLEVEQLVYNILEKREKEIINLKTLQEMLNDDDNTINFSLIDGMYFSLVRSISAELSMRALFPLRVFKFDASLIKDLMIPTYGANILYSEIQQYASSINKESIVELSQKHIEYLHNFIFADKLGKSEYDNLFLEINNIKAQIIKLEEDRDIISSYFGKFYTTITLSEQDKQYKDKLTNYLSCLKQEININKENLCKLQIRNLVYNEMSVIFDKLSFITSTNDKVKQDLSGECKDNEEQVKENNLQTIITDILIKTSLHEVTAIYPEQNALAMKRFIIQQGEKFVDGTNLILEHFINIPPIKQQYTQYTTEQKNLRCLGVTTFSQAKKLLEILPAGSIAGYFSAPITYGMRMIYIPSTDTSEETSVVYTGNVLETFDKIKNDNKNRFIAKGNNNQINSLSFVVQGDIPINEYHKTYSIPYMRRTGDETKFDLINAFPIIAEEIDLASIMSTTKQEVVGFLDTVKENLNNRYTEQLKLKLSCNQELSNFYKLLTNDNMLSNMMIFTSIGILGNEDIKLNFSSIREKLFSSIITKLTYTYSKDQFGELMEKMGSTQYFKQFNADLAVKLSLRAAIYVLQYYCQMTDPNISIALLIRNAIKIALSVASQVPVPGGENKIPSELPLPLTPLAIYSMAQLPITVFGVPPAGIGIGPPLTIPGMVLLGAEAILLALEFSLDIDFNSNNQKINQQLKDMCFDLSGYKKYGVE